MRGSHWMEGQDCILTSVDGGSLTPGEFNGLCRGEAWGESSARLCKSLLHHLPTPRLQAYFSSPSLLLFSEPQFSHL